MSDFARRQAEVEWGKAAQLHGHFPLLGTLEYEAAKAAFIDAWLRVTAIASSAESAERERLRKNALHHASEWAGDLESCIYFGDSKVLAYGDFSRVLESLKDEQQYREQPTTPCVCHCR